MGMDVSPPSRLVPSDQPPPESDEAGMPGYVWIVLIVVVLIGVVIWQTQHLTSLMSRSSRPLDTR
jgi:hypothetical protein